MSAASSRADVERFRRVVALRTGLTFDSAREDFLAELLRQRVRESGAHDELGYLAGLESMRTGREELGVLSEKLTVPETFFFRNTDHFTALLEVALPKRCRARQHERTLRILSAGCASGEEAYSLAMLLLDRAPELAAWNVSILGVDLCPASLRRARQGTYSAWALRATPAEVRERHFRPSGPDFVLSEEVRRRVSFEERNLVEEDPAFWQPGVFDVVFCRNVMMYFEPQRMRSVTARLARSIAPGGYLFLGHAENLRGMSDDFDLRHTHETFYYQRRERPCRPERPAEHWPSLPSSGSPPERFSEGGGQRPEEWVSEIEQASARIEALTRSGVAASPVSGDYPDLLLAEALACLERERFAEAMATLQRLPAVDRERPETRLLYAVLMAHTGQYPEAEALGRLLLTVEPVGAMAHHLIALSREQAGDWGGAVEHDEAASRLEPSFAMPRLHRGRLAKKVRDFAGARRELGRALVLLPQEASQRILLFGGGFTREALTSLCSAELQSVGSTR